MTDQERVHALMDHGFELHAIAAMLSVEVADLENTIETGADLPTSGGGGGGAFTVSSPPDVSNRPFNTLWDPGDGTHPTWVGANFRVTAASGESVIAWLEIWDPALENSYTLGSVGLDRTAETAGVGNAVVEGWAYGLVPPTWHARVKWEGTGSASATDVGVHEQTLS